MRNAFLKDILRDLQRGAGRFVGMFAIVALGVFVFAGLGTAGSVMYIVGNNYYRDNGFYDLQAISTFGLDGKDIKALAAVEGVAEIQGVYGMDGLLHSGTTELNAKIHGIAMGEDRFSQLCPPIVTQGKYPELGNEILVEQAVLDRLGLSLGDEVKLVSGRAADIRMSLKTNRFRIVGVARSPFYFSFERGSSSVGSGEADVFVLIPDECFLQTLYNEALIMVEGASELETFSEEYDALIKKVGDRVKAAGEARIPLQKAEATRKAWIAVGTAQSDLDRQKSELAQQLLVGDNDLTANARALQQGRMDIAAAETELADSVVTLEAQETELRRNLADINGGIGSLRSQEQSVMMSNYKLTRARNELITSEEEYLSSKRDALEAQSQLDEGLSEIAENLGKLDAALRELRENIRALREQRQALLDQYNSSSDPDERDAIMAPLEETGQQLEQLDAQESEMTAMRAELETTAEETLAMHPELDSAFRELRRGRSDLTAGYTDFQSGNNEYTMGLEALRAAIRQMETQKAQVEAGLREVEAMKPELEVARQALAQNRWDFALSQSALEDGKADLISQRESAATEIAAAEAEIRESRNAILDINDPKWYVLNRYENAGFNMYEGEASTITELGMVFPVFFFLVGALISLTTMTRLVEEQRVSMGTYKALGYSEKGIGAKYLFYATAPSLLGSVAGGFLGMAVFPNLITSVYASLFSFPNFDVTVNIPSLLIGTAMAVLSTAIPTLLTCRGALGEVPAGLMRPKTPPAGKKTPLESISILWRRLSFLYKITFRNIFRYKQRLIMTLCGVGGSTALLLAGLGMYDSMAPLVPMQYDGLFQYDMSVSFEDDSLTGTIKSTRKIIDESPLTGRSVLLRQEMMKAHLGDGVTWNIVMTAAESEEAGSFILLRDRVSGENVELGGEGVIVTESMKKELMLEIGSTLVLRDEDDEEFTVTVAGFCEAYTYIGVYMSPEYYRQATGKDYKINTILVSQTEGAPEDELEAFKQTILDRSGVASVTDMATQGVEFSDVLGSMQEITILIIVISALMAFTVLLNLTNINIVERMREIATIEVMGFKDKEVSSYVYRENMIVTFLSALLGVFAGKYLHILLLDAIEGGDMMIPRIITLPSYLIAILATMLFAVAVARITSGKLKKIDMLGALKSAE